MFNNIYFEFLVYSSLTLFNIVMILCVIAIVVIISTLLKMKSKAEDTLDTVQASAVKLSEASFNIASFADQFTLFRKPKTSFFSGLVDRFIARR